MSTTTKRVSELRKGDRIQVGADILTLRSRRRTAGYRYGLTRLTVVWEDGQSFDLYYDADDVVTVVHN